MSNFIDRAIGFFSPLHGLRRHHMRQLLSRAYEGASKRDGWRPRRAGASANADHSHDAATLRARSRALTQNVPYMAAALRSLVANTIGTGIVPNWTGPESEKLNAAWSRWVKYADADGRLDYYGLQAAAYRAMEQDGEVLIRVRYRRPSDGFEVPLQLQLLEIDWLDSSRTGASERRGNTVVNGIEYDMLGKIAGYWLYEQHPGDNNTVLRLRSASSKFYSADQIIHLFTPERPGQGRGFPRSAPVIARARDLQVYEDAEQARKNLEARLSVLASGDVAQMAQPVGPRDERENPDASQTRELGSLAGGSIIQVPAGVNMQVVEPKPAPGYVDTVKWNVHLIAAGYGVTYEMMTGDMTEVNFSSARVRGLDFRREVEMTQWLTVIPKQCDPVCELFRNACVLVGIVRRRDQVLDHTTPKWDYLNPEQDVRADLAEVSGGFSSISEKLRRRGYKPAAVFKELADDITKLRELGLLDLLVMLQKGKPMDEPGAAPPAR